jgi:phosphonate transport system substrate-binding protein
MRSVKWLTALLMTSLMTSILTTAAHALCTQRSLRVAIIPNTTKSLDVLRGEYQPLLERLSDSLHIPVDLVPTSSSYESVIDAVVSGGADIAWLGPASYVMASQRDPRVEPFASLTISPGYFTPAGNHYQSLLLTRHGAFSQIEALRGAQVALSDPASTSGSVVPNFEFSAKVSQPLTRFFSSVVYAGSHSKALDALLDSRVDAAFVASVEVDAYLNNGRIKPDTFDVLWRSEPIYYSPYVFSGALCPELKDQIRTAMFSNQNGLSAFLKSQEATGLVPVSQAEYESLSWMMQQAR